MKKASVVVVLSVLVAALSAHYLLSLKVCRPSSGSGFRGGCYLYSNIKQCKGESISCEDVICEGRNPECQNRQITKIDQIGHYYTRVSSGNEYGMTNYTTIEKVCNYTLTCLPFCEPNRDYTYTCKLSGEPNDIPPRDKVNSLKLTGEKCGNGP